jgi:hypothetical protein
VVGAPVDAVAQAAADAAAAIVSVLMGKLLPIGSDTFEYSYTQLILLQPHLSFREAFQ